MRWRDRRQSEHIEDRRGISGGKLALGGLGGLGGIVVLVLAVLFGADPRQLLEQLPQTGEGARWFRSGFETGNVGMGDTLVRESCRVCFFAFSLSLGASSVLQW